MPLYLGMIGQNYDLQHPFIVWRKAINDSISCPALVSGRYRMEILTPWDWENRGKDPGCTPSPPWDGLALVPKYMVCACWSWDCGVGGYDILLSDDRGLIGFLGKFKSRQSALFMVGSSIIWLAVRKETPKNPASWLESLPSIASFVLFRCGFNACMLCYRPREFHELSSFRFKPVSRDSWMRDWQRIN